MFSFCYKYLCSICLIFFFFFFSSRRRHTRSYGDWSSDVCSSDLYEKCLGGKITFMMTWEGSPMASQTPPGWDKKILHAGLAVGEGVLEGSDAMPRSEERRVGKECRSRWWRDQ